MASRFRPRPPARRIDPASLVVLAAGVLGYAVVAAVRGVPMWTSLLYAGASVLCFVFYAIDKQAAIHGRGRISESMLLSLGLVGGWPGAIVAQQMLRHKTSKVTFRIRFWITVTANVALFTWVALLPHLFDRGA
jgi:uncharacterized membrane protein YsdA (DUF1294 family)